MGYERMNLNRIWRMQVPLVQVALLALRLVVRPLQSLLMVWLSSEVALHPAENLVLTHSSVVLVPLLVLVLPFLEFHE